MAPPQLTTDIDQRPGNKPQEGEEKRKADEKLAERPYSNKSPEDLGVTEERFIARAGLHTYSTINK